MASEGAEYAVWWQPERRWFAASAERTLLQSAEAAGVSLASSCRNGTCRACLQPLAAGNVLYRIPWPGLLPEERTGGWVLPCVAYPASDLVLGAATGADRDAAVASRPRAPRGPVKAQ